MHRLLALAVILVASPAAAAPELAVGLDYTVAHGGAFETWDLGWRLEAGLFFRKGPWHATGSVSGHMGIEAEQTWRDSDSLASVGLGARLAYHVPVDRHGSLFVALGFERLWISSGTLVRRDCQFTGACLAGYYPEAPSYNAWAPQLRVGIGPSFDRPSVLFGGTFEVIVERVALGDVPPAGIVDYALYGAFTFTVGFGPKKR